ncbi:hypothetical protein F8E02_03695 [Methanoculleus sp. Wushi-C6]|uniref:Uncharacterized protein n=1 Tax=Methanoculleus caldifontis TaxID=2651577 RepID=A0ABU3X0G7_9EURY|nr:hypothetical protein [Methanoculleus sp. Wushi-C6]MDV2481127.1 hypothetical protein [Methanoculleus sp. Wushi-C6]
MPSVRINDGDLPSGSGVEGGRKKKGDDTPAPDRREPGTATEKVERDPAKSRHTRPRIGGDDSGADIFYTGTK